MNALKLLWRAPLGLVILVIGLVVLAILSLQEKRRQAELGDDYEGPLEDL